MGNIRWTKYRVLVTNKCNYRRQFCNTLEYFKMLLDLLTTEDIEELNISGGEPFINNHIVNMIEYADTHLKCDISCATNLSLISQSQIKRLARTRVKFNIQFPYVDEKSFKESTGNGNKDTILQNIK